MALHRAGKEFRLGVESMNDEQQVRHKLMYMVGEGA